MAEVLLRARLEAEGIAATVSSAGALFDGRGAERGAIAAVEPLGLDLRSHRSRIYDEAILAPADLVITMEHEHVRQVVTTDGGRMHRTFTFPDLVARATQLGPRRAQTFGDWLELVASSRTTEDVMRADPSLEVGDPMGLSKRAFRQTAAELEGLIDRFVALAWSPDARANDAERDAAVAASATVDDQSFAHPEPRSS